MTLELGATKTALSDMDLVRLTRSGDSAAYGVLWSRHYHAALRATFAISNKHNAEDVVQEAFTRIYQAILQGKGPREVFRAYLYTVLRSTSMNWSRNAKEESSLEDLPIGVEPAYSFEGQVIDKSITARAFSALRPQWKAVLWYLDVENMSPREVGPLLGISANATSALATRAREGLRVAWLQAHLNSDSATAKCKWSVEHMGAYNRKKLPARQRERMQQHLTVCLKCSILIEEVGNLSKNLNVFILPMLLGPAAFSMIDGLEKEGLESASMQSTAVQISAPSKAGFGMLASAVTATGLFAVVALVPPPSLLMRPAVSSEIAASESPQTSAIEESSGHFPANLSQQSSRATREDPAVRNPIAGISAWLSSQPEEVHDSAFLSALAQEPAQLEDLQSFSPDMVTVTPTPTVQPTQTPTVPAQSEDVYSDSLDPPSSEPAASEPFSVPTIDPIETNGLFLPMLSGTGAPGATITILATNKSVGSATVTETGVWSHLPELTLGKQEPVHFSAYQTLDGRVSELAMATEPATLAIPNMSPVQYSEGLGQVVLRGPAGSTVQVLIDGAETGNLHLMHGDRVVRKMPELSPGPHSIVVRFYDPTDGQYGAGYHSKFTVPITTRSTQIEQVSPKNLV